MLALHAPSAFGDAVSWPPQAAAELVGRGVCDFPQASGVGFFSMPVLEYEGYRLDYRKKGEA